MSAITIETKKATDLTKITAPANDNLIMMHDGTGLQTITYQNLAEKSMKPLREQIAPLVFDGAAAHNAVYRGKGLGTAVTDEQYAAISSGTFKDLYIGDYWYIDGVNWRIAAFDYYCNTEDYITHHAVMIPDVNLYSHVMNDTNTTEGGYLLSKMRTEGLNRAREIITTAFRDHVFVHRSPLVNAVSQGCSSGVTWVYGDVELMNEQMVYGCGVFSPVSSGTAVPSNQRVEKHQLPLFQHDPTKMNTLQTYWLRDVVSATNFACLYYRGDAGANSAYREQGVRPAFCIY